MGCFELGLCGLVLLHGLLELLLQLLPLVVRLLPELLQVRPVVAGAPLQSLVHLGELPPGQRALSQDPPPTFLTVSSTLGSLVYLWEL